MYTRYNVTLVCLFGVRVDSFGMWTEFVINSSRWSYVKCCLLLIRGAVSMKWYLASRDALMLT